MEENKKFADMSYLDFTKNILKITLSEDQETLIKLFEENKVKKVEYINNPLPLWIDKKDNDNPYPYITYGKDSATYEDKNFAKTFAVNKR